MEKPLSITIEETKKQLADVLNSSNLHPYIMDTMVKELYQEVHTLYIQMVRQEKAEYEKSLETANEDNTQE